MLISKRIFLLAFATIVFAASVISQTVAGNPTRFLSGQGNFRINLPAENVSVEELTYQDTGGLGRGFRYKWDELDKSVTSIQFLIIGAGSIEASDTEKSEYLKGAREAFMGVFTSSDSYSEKVIEFKGSKGFEIQFRYPASKGIIRAFFAGPKPYTIWHQILIDADLKQAEALLDSFELLHPGEQIAQFLKEATPPDLPQTPRSERPETDLKGAFLRGRVKTARVFEKKSDWKERKLSEISHFTTEGDLVKRISYENGIPLWVFVWGYIDGDRVSSDKVVEHDDIYASTGVQLLSIAPDPNKPKPKRDERYSSRYTYKYDDDGRLSERSSFQNTGKLWLRYVYEYFDRKRTTSYFDADGDLNMFEIERYDKNGNLIESRLYGDREMKELLEAKKYEYSKIDESGNWTSRKYYFQAWDETDFNFVAHQTREIEYYK